MDDKTRAALSDQATWLRLPVMLLFYILLMVATPLLMVVSAVAWVIRLFTGEQPEGVIEFGQTLGKWFRRCSDYLCGAAERRPFPFEDHDCPSDRAVVESSGSGSASAGSSTEAGGPSSAGTGGGASGSEPTAPASASTPEIDEKPVEKAVSARKASKKTTKKKATRKKAARKKSRTKKAAGKKATAKKKTQASAPSDKEGSE